MIGAAIGMADRASFDTLRGLCSGRNGVAYCRIVVVADQRVVKAGLRWIDVCRLAETESLVKVMVGFPSPRGVV